MSRTITRRLTGAVVIVLVAVVEARAEAPRSEPAGIRRAAVLQYEPSFDATFSMGFAPDGSAWTQVEANDLKVEKWIAASGQATISISSGSDRVLLTLTPQGYQVSRGKKSLALSAGNRDTSRRNAVRALLVDSPAVRAFRALTAALEAHSGDESPAMIAAMIDGALVATLDGDDGAADRIGRRATRRIRSTIRPAAVSAQFTDCVTLYERAILAAYNDYEVCIDPANLTFWYSLMYTPFCSAEYFMRAQQYMFQFISCMAIPH